MQAASLAKLNSQNQIYIVNKKDTKRLYRQYFTVIQVLKSLNYRAYSWASYVKLTMRVEFSVKSIPAHLSVCSRDLFSVIAKQILTKLQSFKLKWKIVWKRGISPCAHPIKIVTSIIFLCKALTISLIRFQNLGGLKFRKNTRGVHAWKTLCLFKLE